MLYGMKYSSDQLGSAVPTILSPSFLCSAAEHEALESPRLWVITAQKQLKHQCVINTILILNPKLTRYQPLRGKWTLSWLEPRQELLIWNVITRLVQLRKLFFSFLSSLQKIMKRLIKRYVLKAQIDKESDEVNEGEYVDELYVSSENQNKLKWLHISKILNPCLQVQEVKLACYWRGDEISVSSLPSKTITDLTSFKTCCYV